MKHKKLIFFLILVLSLIFSFSFYVFKDFYSQTKSWGLLGLFIVNVVSNASFFISPSLFAVFAGGAIYPPILVAVVSALGSGVGETVSYIFGYSGRKVFNHKLNKKIWFRVLEDFFEKYGGLLLFIFSLIPNPIFDSFGIIAGIFSYKYYRFFVIIVIARFIRYFAMASIGARF